MSLGFLTLATVCVSNNDAIPLCVDIQNNSTRRIRMKAYIFQKITLKAHDSTNVINKTLASVSSNPIKSGASITWKPDFIVPQLPPTLLDCRFIVVEYFLRVKSDIAFSLSVPNHWCDIPLTLGSVPYEHEATPLDPQALAAALLPAIPSATVVEVHSAVKQSSAATNTALGATSTASGTTCTTALESVQNDDDDDSKSAADERELLISKQ